MLWAIQRGQKDSYLFAEACAVLGVPYRLFDYRPFTGEIPKDIPKDDLVMFYGSVGLCEAVHASEQFLPGVIPITNEWINHEKTLNGKTTFKLRDVLSRSNFTQTFIRPLKDDKLFSGQVLSKVELTKWIADLESKGMEDILDTPVIVSTVKNIGTEWRCFIAHGELVTGSQYRLAGQLMPSPGVPQEVKDFVEANTFPFEVYCIDVCNIGYDPNEFYIIELNGFNSCGVYASDVKELVKKLKEIYG